MLTPGAPAPPSMPTIWFGMRCTFTRAAITGALAVGGVSPAVVVVPRGPRPLGAGWPEPPFDRWLRGIGAVVVEVDRLAGDDLATVARVVCEGAIALGVGACFPWKVPGALRDALPGGVLNIHPSLLPALRGPEPVFHAYRLGLTETGTSVHVMDAGWDSGPVLARERVAIPRSGRAERFEAELARRGGALVSSVAARWLAGTLHAVPQGDGATWAPVPDDADREIPATLSVAQATRFLAACGPLRARDQDGRLVAVESPVCPQPSGSGAVPASRDAVRVPLRDGALWCWPAAQTGETGGERRARD